MGESEGANSSPLPLNPPRGTSNCQITATFFHLVTLSKLFSTSALLGILPHGGVRGGKQFSSPPKSPKGDF